MKKVLAITLMLLLLATAAMCAENSWRVTMKADNGAGLSPSPGAQLGVYPTSIDGVDTQDGTPYTGLSGDLPGTGMHVVGIPDGVVDNAYGKNIKAPTTAGFQEKTWDFIVAANVSSTNPVTRLLLYTVSSTTFPTATVGGTDVKYAVRMVDNKGVEGAPANGTMWDVPIPTVASTTVPFWTCPVNLPTIVINEKSNSALFNQGYKLQLVQTPVPEPSSLIALGTGLVGLVGFVSRRRRA